MSHEGEAAAFLISNPQIKKINFAWPRHSKYHVYPTAYSKDVADALLNGGLLIRVGRSIPSGGSGAYNENTDTLEFGVGFDLKDYHWQATLVHEATHAHLDIQSFGHHRLVENEAVAHIAEAIFLESIHRRPRNPSAPWWAAAQAIAKQILNNKHTLSDSDVDPLVVELNKLPVYANKMIVSNGFKRTLGAKIWRHL